MKIIHNNDPWQYIWTCVNCKSVLEAENNDVKVYHTFSDYYYVICPICAQEEYINSNKLTKSIINRLEQEKNNDD